VATERVYGGKTAAQRQGERREKLLDAGLELFGTRGYAATTIEMLCTEARLNPRYFYEQFESREQLLRAVYDRHVEDVFKSVVDAVVGTPLDPRSRLETGSRAFVAQSLADPRAARINYFEMIGVSRELDTRRREVLGYYVDLTAAQIEEIGLEQFAPGLNLHMVAVAVVAAMDGLCIDALGSGNADPDEIVRTLTDLFIRALT
jgi:AcrR family transcriptional regulator